MPGRFNSCLGARAIVGMRALRAMAYLSPAPEVQAFVRAGLPVLQDYRRALEEK